MIKIDMVPHSEIEAIVDKNFSVVENAVLDSFKYFMNKSIHQPLKTKLTRPKGTPHIEDRIFALPVYVGENEGAGIKWTSRYPEGNNHVLIILNEPTRNKPIAILDGCLIALLRTFAITKICLDIMLPEVRTIAILGMGKLGRLHASYLEKLYPNLSEIKCYSKTVDFKDLCSSKIKACDSLEEALRDVDAFVTCGRQESPYIKKNMLSSKTHLIVNLALFDLEEDVFEAADSIILDEKDACVNAMITFGTAYKNKKVKDESIHLLGDYILEKEVFNLKKSNLTVVNTLGMAVEDIVLAKRIYDQLDLSKMQKFEVI